MEPRCTTLCYERPDIIPIDGPLVANSSSSIDMLSPGESRAEVSPSSNRLPWISQVMEDTTRHNATRRDAPFF